jgi:hypothetical protein
MEERHAGERESKQHEVDRHAERSAADPDHERAGEEAAFLLQQA